MLFPYRLGFVSRPDYANMFNFTNEGITRSENERHNGQLTKN